MGGAAAEIDAATTEVVVEMAWFEAMPIAKSSRRLGLRSEASARFEKGCDPQVVDLAHARFVELLGDAVGSVSPGLVDVVGQLPERPPVRVRTARVNGVLGTDLSAPEIRELLAPIGFHATPAGAGGSDSDVTVPSFRPDSATEIDVVEEVARLHGYERITPAPLTAARFGSLTARQADRRSVRAVLVGLGYAEAMPMPFLAPGDIERTGLPWPGITITNPLIAAESVLRTALLPGLLKTLAYNESHRNTGAGLFEIGHVFRRSETAQPLPDEREHVGVVRAGVGADAAVEAWEALAGVLAVPGPGLRNEAQPGLHPTRSAVALVGDVVVGCVGEVDPEVLDAHGITERVAVVELDLGRLIDGPHGERPYKLVSRYPSSDLDLAFWVTEEVPAGQVTATLRRVAADLLARIELFDVYRGPGAPEGSRGLAYKLRFQAADRTLTDSDLQAAQQAAVAAVVGEHGAVHRG
jgi:phenylalanyl-tRNA synthetase beta chain